MTQVGKISENIGSASGSSGMVRLQSEFDIFLETTKQCDQLSKEAQALYKNWGEQARRLREVVIHTEEKAGEAAWHPMTRLMIYTESEPVRPVSTPVIPTLSPPNPEVLKLMSVAAKDDVLWVTLPDIEKWFRRCYKLFTMDAAGGCDWTYVKSKPGQLYISVIHEELQKFLKSLTHSPAAQQSSLITHLGTVASVGIQYE